MAQDGPLDRLRENATGIASTVVTGIWLGALLTGQGWWLGALIIGYVVVVPIVAICSATRRIVRSGGTTHPSMNPRRQPNLPKNGTATRWELSETGTPGAISPTSSSNASSRCCSRPRRSRPSRTAGSNANGNASRGRVTTTRLFLAARE